MTPKTDSKTYSIHTASLGKRMLQGSIPALILIILFLSGVGEGNPAWGKFWIVRPLIIVPIAGAAGGVFYYLMENVGYQGGWKKVLAITLSIVGYLFILWIGTILGLDGTLWD